ncbi:helix-turn-helix domain-containing protein [Rhizobium sp. 814_E9_N1_1]|uniref:helix-turn-helix domain-containing protein n=1 Tax=unclassified Rhizobium TaxID=2613769 RepID=UPI003F225E28
MAGRRPNRRAIKRHYSYTVEEAAKVLGVAKGSVRRWLKAGLQHIADQRPFLILGGDLRDFLAKRDKPKQRCALHEFFCFRCREPRPAAGGLIDYTPRTALSGQLSAICEACETITHKNFSASKLPLLERQAAVSFPQGHPRLNEMGNPRCNDHFEKGLEP